MNYISKGTIFNNRYVVDECVGMGGMAVVYKGIDSVNGTTVALKVLKPEFGIDEQNVTRFKKEAESAYRLNHENIVKIYGVGCCSGIHYIAMQYIDGITLSEYMEKNGAFEWKSAFEIIRQVLSALSFAHESGVVHRDIKPQNILIDDNMHITLTDFGIARDAINSNTINANTDACSVHYLSPEQAKGTLVDGRSDIYSLGITLYEMLVGSVPFDGENTVAVALKHLQSKIVPPCEVDPSIPVGVSDIVMMATMRDMGKRFQSAEEMLAQMRIVSENENISFWVPPLDYVRIAEEISIETLDDGSSSVENTESTGDEDDFDDGDMKSFVIGGAGKSSSAAEREDTPIESTDADEGDEEISEDDYEGDSAGRRGMRLAGKIITYVIAAILAVAAVIFIVMTYKEIAPKPGEVYRISNYEGHKAVDVIAALEAAGINVVQEETFETKGYPSGYIVSQDKSADTKLSEGDTITIQVALEEGHTTVVSCVGLDYREAKDRIEKKELKVEIEYVPGKSSDEGTVLRVLPVAGTALPKGETVTLYVCSGTVCEAVRVPDLKGLSLQEAIKALNSVGLKVGNLYPDPESDMTEILATPGPESSDMPLDPDSTEFPPDEETTETPSDIPAGSEPTESEHPDNNETSDSATMIPVSPVDHGDEEAETSVPSLYPTVEPSTEPDASFLPSSDIPSETPTVDSSETPSGEPTDVFIEEPTPEPLLASKYVVAQYPAAGSPLYKGDTVDLYFYSPEELNKTEVPVEQTFTIPSENITQGEIKIVFKYLLGDGSEEIEIINVTGEEQLPVTFSVPFSFESKTTEVNIYVNDLNIVYEKRIVRRS